MLTISQLADYVGVTVRAVRHYHQRGLLAEPPRDASGYRSYDAQAVIDLIRIRTLAAAGVPLARVEELLGADPEQFARAADRIDRDLAVKIRELTEHRERIAALVAGERLFLPPEAVEYLDELRALGLSARTVQVERDGWIMLAATFPDGVAAWIAEKHRNLADPEFQRMYRRYDEAADWDPDDPRLQELADDMIAYIRARLPDTQTPVLTDLTAKSPNLDAVLASYVSTFSRPWTRLNELMADRTRDLAEEAGQDRSGGTT